MKKSMLFFALSAMTLSCMADEMRPHVIHTDYQSCLYSYNGNETYVTCDESARVIDKQYQAENARIDRIEAEASKRDAEYAEEKAARKAKLDAVLAEGDAKIARLNKLIASPAWRRCSDKLGSHTDKEFDTNPKLIAAQAACDKLVK